MLIPVLAAEPTVTNITGVTGVNGTFNVNPTEIHGSTGFRNYNNFDVAKGDVANMVFGSNYDKFINLVGNQVNIYGILNSTDALGNFANGHAIFVTPQGMVVGASGVINVGALSVFTPGKLPSIGSFGTTQGDIDKALGGLESGNQGVITVNGKIFAREGVNLYGKDITVAKATGATVTPTILAGIKDDAAYNTALTTAQQAEVLFNSLVNTDGIAKGDAFANENGTLVIKAQDSAKMAFNVDAATTFSPALELGNLGKAESSATVTISDAILAASSMDISAESKATYATESAIAPGVLASLILDLIDYVSTGETSTVGYVGGKSNATVNITNSKLTSAGDININSSASSSMTVSDSDIAKLEAKGISVAESAQQVLYSFGTETNSEVNIKNSTIKATEGDVKLYAGSSNSLDISMTNQNSYSDVATDIDSAGKSTSLGGAKVLLAVTHTDANTKATVDKDSTIEAENVTVAAVNATSNSIETTAKVKIGESTDTAGTSKTYNTVVTVDGVLNVTNVNTTAQVAGNVTATKSALDTNTADNVADKKIETKVGDTTTTTYTKGSTGNVNVIAQNVYISSISASAETEGKTEKTKTADADSSKKSLLESITSKFNNFIEKSSDDSGGSALSKVGFGGAAIINISNVNAKAEVTNTATVKADRNLNITANTLDLTTNSAAASVSGAKYAPAVSLIVNVQHDTTTAQIADGDATTKANVDVKGDININSTTEMPLNLSTVAEWVEIFSSGASIFTSDFWTKDAVNNIEQAIDTVCGKVGEIGDITSVTDLADTGTDKFGGFFNNYAKANSKGDSLSIGGSIIVSVVDNTTKSYIGNNANITVGNDINLNSSNFIVYNNLAGMLNSLSFGFFKNTEKEADSKGGVGGSLIIGVNNHTANSSIGNSVSINVPTDGTTASAKAAASNTDINLSAGTIANYINIAAGGSTGSSLAATGSIVVTYVGGSTITGIGNSNKINANSLTLNSGVASIKLADTNFNLTEDTDSTDAEVSQVAGVDESESTSKTEGNVTTTTYNNNYGFLDLKNTTNVYDQTNIINVTGALSVQRSSSSGSGGSGGSGGTGGSGSSSGGTALGASINVAVLNRNLNSSIGNNNAITLGDSLNVSSNTSSVIANVALAGSFTGGASPKKPTTGTGGGTTGGSSGGASGSSNSDAGGWQTKVSAILDKITGATDSSKSGSAASKTSSVNPNTADSNANSKAGDALKTSTTSSGGSTTSGSETIGSKLADSSNLNSTGTNSSTATNNLSVAAAGSINGKYTSNTVSSSVGNSSITTGTNTAKAGNIGVNANQSNILVNLSTGVAAALKKSSTGGGSSSSSTSVGAGAALNLSLDMNKTSANIGNATSDSTDTTDYAEINSKGSIAIGAKDSTVAVNAAVGVGATSSGSGSGGGSSTSVAIGGSFNTSYFGNSASSYIGKNVKITNSASLAVNSELSTILLNAAGGINVSAVTGSSGTSVGAGIAANINVFTQDTDSEIMSGANITSTGAVVVNALNKNYDISAGIAGSVVTGGENSYTFTGAIGTDVIVNTTKALIDGATISSKSLSVMAENDITNYNLAGSITFSASQTSYGVGVGAVVDVNASTTQAGISNSTITSTEEINVKATQNETLRFLALNGMVSTGGGSGFSLGLNGIVDVLSSTVDSFITNSTINSATNSNVISTYNTSMAGITGVGGISTGASSLASANLVANVLVNTVSSRVENSDIAQTGKLTIKSDVDELIDIIPVAVSISSSGTAAVAANIVANIIVDSVNAKLTGKKTTSGQVTSNGGVEVNASDDSTIRVRGGTLSATGGSAGVGGSILLDVLVKSVNASIEGGAKVVSSNGNVDVKASAENIFGVKSDVLDSASSIKNLTNEVTSGTALSDITDLLSWEMTFDVAGGNSAGVSGSLIAKTIVNSVSSSISNADVTGKSVNVLADNATYIRAIVGNITGGGTAAVGGSFFVNTLVGSTVAKIDSGASVTSTGTDAKSGDVNVKATSTEDVTTVMAVGGGAGTVAVNGSLNVNTIVDTTKATINGSKVVAAQNLNVEATEHNEISTLNLSVSGSGSASVGVVGYVNTFVENVEASIVDSTSTDNSKSVKAGKDINVKATGTDNFGGVLAVAAGSGAASVAGLVVANTMAASVNSYISNSIVTSTSGLVGVTANYDYNKTEYGKKDITGFLEYLNGDKDGSTHEFSISDVDNYIPIVGLLNVTGSAYASVGVTLMANTVVSSINAYVANSNVASQNGLSVKANTDVVLYNVMVTMAFSGIGASVPVTGLVNTLVNSTTASVSESTVTGSVDVEAKQLADLNDIIVSGSVTGIGGAVSANILTNVIASTTTANIKDSVVNNANSVKVLADSEANVNNLSIVGVGAGVGGAVTGTINTTVLAGSTNAYIADTDSSATSKATTINANTVDVEASSDLKTFDLIAAATVSGVGADVGVNIATNVILNGVYAYIDKANLNINSSTTVKATSDLDIYDTVANCGVNLVGASVGGTIITNVIDNNIAAHASNSTITGGSVDVEAEQDTNLSGGIISINAGGLSVAASAHAATNVLIDNVSAFIDNSALTSNTGTKVKGTIKENIDYITASASVAGIGGIAGSVLTNVIATDLNAYTSGGSISSTGAIDVEANTTISLNNISGGIQAGAVAVGARTIANTLTNKTKAYMDDTAVDNSGSLTVKAASTETIYNNNYGASAGLVSGGIGVVVNVIENDTKAYIDAKADNVNTSGSLNVTANDTLSLQNIAGIAAVSTSSSGSSSININIINNAVLAELKGTTGTIIANSVDVNSVSTMALDTVTASASGGLVGVAGAISITSIGDRISSSDSDYNTYTSDYTTKAKDNSSNKAQKVDYNHDGIADYDYTGYSNAQNLDAGTDTAKEGTVANITANVTSTNAVNVTASNTVKGLSDDTFTTINDSTAIGGVAGSASILVTDMNYKTTAEITGGTVKSTTDKAITVSATNTIKAETDAVAATVGAVGIGGNVAVIKNKAKTTAKVQNSALQTKGAINVLANSTDGIVTRTVNGTAGLAAINYIVALSKTNNETSAIIDSTSINGGSASVSSGDLNVKATNTSILKSDMESATVGGVSVSALVNLAYSDAITAAVISGRSDIYANTLNLISQTGGISAESVMHVGSLSYLAGASVGVSGATVNATFNSTVGDADGSATKIKTAGDTTLKAGVNSSNNSLGGDITAKVSSTAVTAAGLLAASVTTQNANANANTNIKSFSGSSIDSGHDVIAFSALNRTATTGSTSGSIGTVSIGALTLDAETAGTSNIELNGSTKAVNNINIDVNDTNTATASMFSATASLAGGSATVVKAIVNSNATITTGSMTAQNVDIDTNVTRTASSSGASGRISGFSLDAYLVDTEANGSSTITLGGASSNVAGAITADINDTNTATANAVSVSGSLISGSATRLKAIVGSNSTINTTGTIAANIIDLTSNSTRTASIGNTSLSVSALSISTFYLDAETNGNSTINVNGSLTADTIDIDVNDTNTATAKMVGGQVSLIGGAVTNITAKTASNAYINSNSTSKLNATNIYINSSSSRTSYVKNTSVSGALISLRSTNMTSSTEGSTNYSLLGNVAGKNSTNAASALQIGISDSSSASNDSANSSISFIGGSSLAIQSSVSTSSDLTLGGKVLADNVGISSSLNRNATANAASSAGGLASISSSVLKTSLTGNSNVNLSGIIDKNQTLSINSTANNTERVALSQSSAGLIALSRGNVQNYVNTKNYINFKNGTDINSTGNVNATASTNNTIYMDGGSSSSGFIAVGGGTYTNNINVETGITANGTAASTPVKINAANITLRTTNNTTSPNGVHFDDGSGGFVTDSGGKIDTDIVQKNAITIDNYTQIYASDTLTMDMDNNSNFAQYISSSSSGAGCYNSARSELNVTNRNYITISEDRDKTKYYVKGKTVAITEDVNNNLTSDARIEASHFAGDPTVSSYLYITNDNRVDVDSLLTAEDLMKISMMTGSSNVINQYAYARVKAAVATSSRSGGLGYISSNIINIASGGKIASGKDVAIKYSSGSESLNSSIAYKHTHYALFGIPINKSGSSSALSTSRTKALVLNGELEAGSGGSKKMTINADGSIDTTSTIDSTYYTKYDTTSKAAENIASDRIAELNELITALSAEKASLQADATENSAAIATINSQLASLNSDLANNQAQLATLQYIATLSNSVALSSVKTDLNNLLTNKLGSSYTGLSANSQSYLITSILSSLLKENADGTYSTSGVSMDTAVSNALTAVGLTSVDATTKGNLSSALTDFKGLINTTSATIGGTSTNLQTYKIETTTTYTIPYQYAVATTAEGGAITITYYDGTYTTTVAKGTVVDTSAAALSTATGKTVTSVGTAATTPNYTAYTVFDDSLSVGASISAIQGILNASISTLNTNKTALDTSLASHNALSSSFDSQILTLTNQIDGYNQTKTDLASGLALGINNSANSAYLFKDMKMETGGITISGVTSISGSGSFVINTADLLINNHSNYNLIFNDISVAAGKAGVSINGYSFTASKYNTPESTGLDSTKIELKGNGDNAGQITINSWFDSNSPLATTPGSNLVFLGYLSNAVGNVNIYNESENIICHDIITAKDINLIAPLGNVSLTSKGSDLNISSTSQIIAGGDVKINVGNTNKITLAGTIKAGNSTRNIVIDDEMLTDDKLSTYETVTSGGKTYYIVNLKEEKMKSAYLNADGTNSIKFLYDDTDHKILVYDTAATQGGVSLTGKNVTTTEDSKITYSTGYGNVSIKNNTTNDLIVNDITNNYANKTYTISATSTSISPSMSITANGESSAVTNVTSDSSVVLAGLISSGNNGTGAAGIGTLSISSGAAKPITVNNQGNNYAIDATGTLDITSNSDLIVNGKINNRNGLTTLTNAGITGRIAINDRITTNGGLTLDNYGSNGITIAASLTNNSGNLRLINETGAAGSILVNDIIRNTGIGFTAIANNGDGGITINGDVSNDTGYLVLYNVGLGNIQINGDVTNNYGNTLIINNQRLTGINIAATSTIQSNTGYIRVANAGNAGVNIEGRINNDNGTINIENSAGGVEITARAGLTNNNGDILITNYGSNGILINGQTSNITGNTKITNETGSAGGINIGGTVANDVHGDIIITNKGAGGITVTSTGVVNNTGDCDVTLNNAGSGGVVINGNVSNKNGTLKVENSGFSGINIAGTTSNKKGDTIITNNAGAAGGIEISGKVENLSGSTTITNNGSGGITVTQSGLIANEIGKLTLANTGFGNVTIAGALRGFGGISISNTTTSAYGIEITSTGTVSNDVFDLDIHNFGTNGITIAGVVSNTAGNMSIINETAGDIVIGNASTDNNLTQDSGNVLVSNKNGNILNAGNDKTLINLTNGNLVLESIDGNIGSYDTSRVSTLANKYGIEAATRDYTESFNVTVSGTITASAKNSAKTDSRLINLRAKNSDMNINKIDSDGDILLTAADWADSTNDSGYSIVNASSDPTVANITGKNISLISSKNIGAKDNWITFNQTDTTASWLSAEAEKDLYIKALSDDYNTNIWAMIAKTGSMGLELSGNTIIREITANGDLQIVNRGAELNIYDIGRLTHMLDVKDDLLYAHDKIAISGISPETLNLQVLDINKNTRVDKNAANSILRIANAYVKGQNAPEIRYIDGTTSIETDIILKADNIYANRDGSSMFIRLGDNNTTDRKYYDNPLDTSSKLLSATGFNSVNDGSRLVFDVQGVSPDSVKAIGRNESERNYYSVDTVRTIDAFQNVYAQFGKNYMAKNITLSINANENNYDNRGSTFNHLYSDFAYVDTMDKKLTFKDTVIGTYAEFRNGNGLSGYMWTTADDNRPAHTILDFATLQLYTKKTGSFYVSMNDTIVLGGNPPVVYANPNVLVQTYESEESFVKQLLKDTTIQHKTTTADYDDIDKDTYKPTQRNSLRFTNEQGAEHPISDNDSSILGIKDISTTGVQVKQDGTLKVGDQKTITIPVGDETVSLQIQIVRTSKDGQYAGAKFLNMDQATANKLLYFKMQAQAPTGGRSL